MTGPMHVTSEQWDDIRQQCDDMDEYCEDLDEEDDPDLSNLDRDLMGLLEDRSDIGDALLDLHRREADLDTRLQAQALWGDERREYRQPY